MFHPITCELFYNQDISRCWNRFEALVKRGVPMLHRDEWEALEGKDELLILDIKGYPRSFEATLQFHISPEVVKCARLHPVYPVKSF